MAKPTVDKVGHELIDRLSTVIRPNCKYKTDRPDLDGSGIDVHAMIGKLPKPKKGWTLPGHNYTKPYKPLEKQLVYDPETGNITPIYQPPLPGGGGEGQPMQLPCNTMSTMAFAITAKKKMLGLGIVLESEAKAPYYYCFVVDW